MNLIKTFTDKTFSIQSQNTFPHVLTGDHDLIWPWHGVISMLITGRSFGWSSNNTAIQSDEYSRRGLCFHCRPLVDKSAAHTVPSIHSTNNTNCAPRHRIGLDLPKDALLLSHSLHDVSSAWRVCLQDISDDV